MVLPIASFIFSSCFQDSFNNALSSLEIGSEYCSLIRLTSLGKISAWFFKCRDFTQPIITENIQAVLKSLRRKRKLSKITSHWKWRSYLMQEGLDPLNLFNLYTRPGWSQCIILHIIFSTLCFLPNILPKHCVNYLGTAEISKRIKKQSLHKILRGRQGLLWETCKWWIVGSRLIKGHCFFELRYVLRDEFWPGPLYNF